MIGKILAVAGISAVAVTVVDKYNLLGINPTGAWWWERILPQTQAARQAPFPIRQPVPQVYTAGLQMNPVPRPIPSVGKYQITANPTPEPPYRAPYADRRPPMFGV